MNSEQNDIIASKIKVLERVRDTSIDKTARLHIEMAETQSFTIWVEKQISALKEGLK